MTEETKKAPTIDDIRVSINPAILQKVLPFMAVRDIRYYLNGIHVEKADAGGVYVLATDGHTMGIYRDATGSIEGAEEVTFRVAPGLAAAAKMAGKKAVKGMNYRLLVQGQRVKIACDFASEGATELFVQAGHSLIEGKFPNWRKVVPEFSKLKPGCKNGMNAIYLARLSKLVGERFQGVTLWQEATDKAVVAQIALVPEMIVVIMPMRETETDPAKAFKDFDIGRQKEALPELEAA